MTGRIYEIGRDVAAERQLGEMLERADLERHFLDAQRRPTEDERAAMEEAEALVLVGERAAQVAKLGERELERRMRRKGRARRS
jgi:sialic acid synthase SpsE